MMEQNESRHRGRQSRIGSVIDRNSLPGEDACERVDDAGLFTAGPATFRLGEKDDADDVLHGDHLSFRMTRFV
jgi:hypothetical protein